MPYHPYVPLSNYRTLTHTQLTDNQFNFSSTLVNTFVGNTINNRQSNPTRTLKLSTFEWNLMVPRRSAIRRITVISFSWYHLIGKQTCCKINLELVPFMRNRVRRYLHSSIFDDNDFSLAPVTCHAAHDHCTNDSSRWFFPYKML